MACGAIICWNGQGTAAVLGDTSTTKSVIQTPQPLLA